MALSHDGVAGVDGSPLGVTAGGFALWLHGAIADRGSSAGARRSEGFSMGGVRGRRAGVAMVCETSSFLGWPASRSAHNGPENIQAWSLANDHDPSRLAAGLPKSISSRVPQTTFGGRWTRNGENRVPVASPKAK
jgi:hypothetical protein